MWVDESSELVKSCLSSAVFAFLLPWRRLRLSSNPLVVPPDCLVIRAGYQPESAAGKGC